MPFVKLDCGILDSTLWPDRIARELFITALLMAEPYEIVEPEPQIAVRGLEQTGFIVPPGWYGIVRAAGIGIVRRAGIDPEEGLDALERLGATDQESRTPRFEGRRLVRVNGGFLALNFDLYRSRDYTSAERSRRYREKKLASRVTELTTRVTPRDITQAEAKAEAEAKGEEALTQASVSSNQPVITRDYGRLAERPSIAEVQSYASTIGLAAWKAADWFDEMEGCGWLDFHHRPIIKWKPILTRVCRKWESDGRPKGPPANKQPPPMLDYAP